jgi:hypothetical protein
MSETFRVWDVEQEWLQPSSVLDFVPLDVLALFFRTLRATYLRV